MLLLPSKNTPSYVSWSTEVSVILLCIIGSVSVGWTQTIHQDVKQSDVPMLKNPADHQKIHNVIQKAQNTALLEQRTEQLLRWWTLESGAQVVVLHEEARQEYQNFTSTDWSLLYSELDILPQFQRKTELSMALLGSAYTDPNVKGEIPFLAWALLEGNERELSFAKKRLSKNMNQNNEVGEVLIDRFKKAIKEGSQPIRLRAIELWADIVPAEHDEWALIFDTLLDESKEIRGAAMRSIRSLGKKIVRWIPKLTLLLRESKLYTVKLIKELLDQTHLEDRSMEEIQGL